MTPTLTGLRLRALRLVLLGAVAAVLAGCGTLVTRVGAIDEVPVISGSAPRRNETPMEPALVCLRQAMLAAQARVPSVTVGDVKDYTGKYSQNEGNAITQGGALMVYSALGKLGQAIRLHERFDTRIAELELAYADRRQLGDGQLHPVEAGKPPVPWVPYFGGSILRSDYYIVGGITEVNYNIASRGGELSLGSVGARQRTFNMNVGVDLRIIDTRSLQIIKTVSLQKQITGEEVGVGVFRFFGSELLDLNVGAKGQEPLQLGVRTTIEQGVVELMAAVAGMEAQPCISFAQAGSGATQTLDAAVAGAARPMLVTTPLLPAGPTQSPTPANAPATSPASPPANPAAALSVNGANSAAGTSGQAINVAKPGSAGSSSVSGPVIAVNFDTHSSALDGTARSVLGGIAKAATDVATIRLHLLARETENLPSAQRQQLAQARVAAVSDALVALGLAAPRIRVDWLPDASSPVERQGAGLQVVARLSVLPAVASVSAAGQPPPKPKPSPGARHESIP